MSHFNLQGSIVALVTPMQADGSLDWEALDRLIEFHLQQGTHGIVAMGTTGESATLSVSEHIRVVERIVECVNDRIPVIAGTGANSTSEAIQLTQSARNSGVDACLLVVPYYNKPTQDGLYQHFMAVADAVDIPQILYNVPGRTITDMTHETVLRLAVHPNIVAIKDATGDVDRGKALIDAVPEGFVVYSGDDPTAVELMLHGAKGNISVTANVVPQKMAQMCQHAIAGEATHARQLHEIMMPLNHALFVESNPIPVKWAVASMGLMPAGIRLPLTPLSETYQSSLQAAISAVVG